MSLNLGDTILKHDPDKVIGHNFLHNFLEKRQEGGNFNLFIIKRISFDTCWAYKLSNFDWISDQSHKISSGRVVLVERVDSRLKDYYIFQSKTKSFSKGFEFF